MSIVRAPRPTSQFTVMRNDVLRDQRLSYRALGVLVEILSRPDNWQTNAENLARGRKEGRDAIRTALAELRKHGYIEHQRVRGERGRMSTVSYVYDEPRATVETPSPRPENPAAGGPAVGQPAAGNSGLISSTDTNNREEGLSRKDHLCAPSSSSNATPDFSKTDEDDVRSEDQIPSPRKPATSTKRQQKTALQQRRRDDATQTMLDETHAVDDLDIKALAAYYEQDERYNADDGRLYLAGVIERDGSGKAAEHLDDARDMFGDWIDQHRLSRNIKERRRVIAEWAGKQPWQLNPEAIGETFERARRAGVGDDDLVAAINAVKADKLRDPQRAYIRAMEKLIPARAMT